MSGSDKPLIVLYGEIKTPPFSHKARREAGYLLRELQGGKSLGMPHSRPLPVIGRRCHELRINDVGARWRIIYRVDPHAVVIVDIFDKKTRNTPAEVIARSMKRLRKFDDA